MEIMDIFESFNNISYFEKNKKIKMSIQNLEYLIYSKKDNEFFGLRKILDFNEDENIKLKIEVDFSDLRKEKEFKFWKLGWDIKVIEESYFKGILEFSNNYIPILIYSRAEQINDKSVIKNFWHINFKDFELAEILKNKFIKENSLDENLITIGNEFISDKF